MVWTFEIAVQGDVLEQDDFSHDFHSFSSAITARSVFQEEYRQDKLRKTEDYSRFGVNATPRQLGRGGFCDNMGVL